MAYGNLSSVLGSYGRFEDAVAVALEGAEASRRLGIWISQGIYCTCNAAENLIDLGRLDEAERLVAEALQRRRAASSRDASHRRRRVCATRGELDAAGDHLEAARHAAGDFALEHRGLLARTAAPSPCCVGVLARPTRSASRPGGRAEGGDEMIGAMLLSAGLRAEAALPRRRAARDTGALDAAWRRLQAGLDPERRRSPEIDAHVATAAAERSRLQGASDPERWAAAQAAWTRSRCCIPPPTLGCGAPRPCSRRASPRRRCSPRRMPRARRWVRNRCGARSRRSRGARGSRCPVPRRRATRRWG